MIRIRIILSPVFYFVVNRYFKKLALAILNYTILNCNLLLLIKVVMDFKFPDTFLILGEIFLLNCQKYFTISAQRLSRGIIGIAFGIKSFPLPSASSLFVFSFIHWLILAKDNIGAERGYRGRRGTSRGEIFSLEGRLFWWF